MQAVVAIWIYDRLPSVKNTFIRRICGQFAGYTPSIFWQLVAIGQG